MRVYTGPAFPALHPAEALAIGAALADLEPWPPCGELLAGLRSALAGDGGLREVEVARLRDWAARWKRFTPGLRAFYAAEAPVNGSVADCLWYALGHGRYPSTVARGIARRRFEARYGFPPPWALVP